MSLQSWVAVLALITLVLAWITIDTEPPVLISMELRP
jgi:hypothetical protein